MDANPWKAPCQDIQRHPAVAHAEVLCGQSKWEHQPGEEKQYSHDKDSNNGEVTGLGKRQQQPSIHI